MSYISVLQFAKKHGISERTVRNYCVQGKIDEENWGNIHEYLTDTCFTAQDNYKALLEYFRVKY